MPAWSLERVSVLATGPFMTQLEMATATPRRLFHASRSALPVRPPEEPSQYHQTRLVFAQIPQPMFGIGRCP
jgi:hypothetical protein